MQNNNYELELPCFAVKVLIRCFIGYRGQRLLWGFPMSDRTLQSTVNGVVVQDGISQKSGHELKLNEFVNEKRYADIQPKYFILIFPNASNTCFFPIYSTSLINQANIPALFRTLICTTECMSANPLTSQHDTWGYIALVKLL